MKHFTTTKFQVLSFRIPDILQRISQGSLSVPDFQRPFVWTYKHKLELFESIVAGIPIGILTFWRTEQRCQIYQKIGPFKIPVQLQSLSKDYINDYILDGHQRIATLFGVLNSSREQAFSNNYTSHKSVLMSEQKPPQWTIYYDLEHGVFADATKETSNPFYIPLHSLIRTFDFLHEREKIFRAIKGDVSHYIERAEHLAQIFWNYEIPIVYITGSTLEEAIETFSRLNSQGHNLTSEQKFNISTYRTTISSRIDTILERLSNDKFKFSTIDKTFILKVIFAALEKDIYKTNINDSINHNILYIDDVIDACKSSLLKVGQFLYEEIKVPNDRFLPYKLQIIFLSEFFRLCPYPSQCQIDLLKQWFWVTSYTDWLAERNSKKIKFALSEMRNFALGKGEYKFFGKGKYLYNVNFLQVANPFPKYFEYRNPRVKAFILFLSSWHPKSIKTGQDLDTMEILNKYAHKALIPIIPKNKRTANRVISDYIIYRYRLPYEILIQQPLNEEILYSHAIPKKAIAFLKDGDHDSFLNIREENLIKLEQTFMKQHGVVSGYDINSS